MAQQQQQRVITITQEHPVALVYDGNSTVKFRGHQMVGWQMIAQTVNFYVQHCDGATMHDFQHTGHNGGILLTLGGQVHIPGERHPRLYEQVLILVPNAEGSYYVQNDIFRTIPA